MKASNLLVNHTPPVVIGGVGGSGTRLIAQCLNELGFFMGHDLNEASDNLWFTLLFKRTEILDSSDREFGELVDIFLKGMTGLHEFTNMEIDLINQLASIDRDQHPATWLRIRANTILSATCKMQPSTRWAWKEPNTHIVLDRLIKYLPKMKYIHVTRNGLDMAHSGNQNQLALWGRYFICEQFNISPYYSLKYWCTVHRRVLEIGQSIGRNFLFLNYDKFCLKPDDGIMELCTFLELNPTSTQKDTLIRLIKPPSSIGRFKQHGIKLFDEDDIAYVSKLGFDVNSSSTVSQSWMRKMSYMLTNFGLKVAKRN
jgi:hypothetical protein